MGPGEYEQEDEATDEAEGAVDEAPEEWDAADRAGDQGEKEDSG
jgi:hypothetical protein